MYNLWILYSPIRYPHDDVIDAAGNVLCQSAVSIERRGTLPINGMREDNGSYREVSIQIEGRTYAVDTNFLAEA
jgi:hypothetical protein